MIHLCYLKKYLGLECIDSLNDLKQSIRPSDLLIFSNGSLPIDNSPREKDIDLEKLSSQKISNICLIGFEHMKPIFIQTLIGLKSKDTEIIGISNFFNDMHQRIMLTTQECLDMGMNIDEISIFLALRENIRPEISELSLQEYKYKTKNSRIKEIKNIEEVKKFFKYSE
jgi:hypothetical protein